MITLKFDKCDISYFAFTLSLKRMRLLFFTLFSFTNRELDPVAGNYFAQARQYDSQVGRFVSEDLIKGVQTHPFTLNTYAYCWNQPMNFVDLDGLAPQPTTFNPNRTSGPRNTGSVPGLTQPTAFDPNRTSGPGSSSLTSPRVGAIDPWWQDRSWTEGEMSSQAKELGSAMRPVACSITVEVEAGFGIAGSLSMGPVKPEAGLTVHNSTTFTPSGMDNDWVFNTGLGLANQGGFGAGLSYQNTNGQHEGSAGILLPGNSTLAITTEDTIDTDTIFQVGGRFYFFLGGGGNITFNLSEYARQRKIVRPFDFEGELCQ